MSNVSVYLTCCRAFKNLPVNLCSTLSPTHTPDLQISQGWHSVSCSSAFTDISYFFSIKCAMLYCSCAKPVSYSQQWAIMTAGLHTTQHSNLLPYFYSILFYKTFIWPFHQVRKRFGWYWTDRLIEWVVYQLEGQWFEPWVIYLSTKASSDKILNPDLPLKHQLQHDCVCVLESA